MMVYEVLWAPNHISGIVQQEILVDSNAAGQEKTQELVEPKRPILLRHLLCHLSGPQTRTLTESITCRPVNEQSNVENHWVSTSMLVYPRVHICIARHECRTVIHAIYINRER